MNPNASAFTPSWLPPAAKEPEPEPAPSQADAEGWEEHAEDAVVPTQDEPAAVEEPEAPVEEEKEPEPAPEPEAAAEDPVETPPPQKDGPAKVPKVKAKEPEIVYDHREHLNVVFIGHVDAGKSTISGNILFLTGGVDDRTIEKYEKEAKDKNRESWFLAFIMDTNEEERAKGKTVEVGRAHFESENKRYTVLDAPGHKNYVPNMISGASQADVGVLVISARKGEFETGFERGGQTREHAMLAKTLGVRVLIVAVNKMDTCNWDKERFDSIVNGVSPFLKQCGFNLKKDVLFVPVSGLQGSNIKDRKDTADWFDGKTLLETMDTIPSLDRDLEGAVRMPVMDKFKDMGTIVTGKIEAGTIKEKQKLIMMPNNISVEVQQITIDDTELPAVKGGENIQLKLKGIEEDDIKQGYVLCSAPPIPVFSRFLAQVAVVELLEHKSIICSGYCCILHIHAAAEECEIATLVGEIDKKTGEKKKRPKFVKGGAVIVCEITTASPLCAETFKDFQQLGRFTLRDEGKTIAIGKILKILPDKN